MHTTAHEAALVAKEANVGQLIIGHYSARIKDEESILKEAKNVFTNVILAQEGLKIDII
jgi:ribonuclease Z